MNAEELREQKREIVRKITELLEDANKAVKDGILPEWEYDLFCYNIADAAGIIIR